ncbi:MAG: outer membrane protein OmpA-like peptidoglycan-associated protein [Halioglobus sp.]|jgi:outer membrane protein OmpA-like peptidoglycan-associated protein
MSINLLDMLKDQVTGSLAKQASGFLGESEDNVSSALGGIFPVILGAAVDKASKPSEASEIMDMIGGLDMGMLGDIGGLFGGGASSVNGLINSGGGIVESLLGDKMGGIVSMTSKMSGLKSGSSSSLMKMAAPFLMGIIGNQVSGKGLGFLTDMLMGQKDHVAAALPSGMGDLLGLGNLLGGAKDVLGAVTGAATGTVSGAAGIAGDTVSRAANVAGDAASAVTGAVDDAASALTGVAENVAGLAGDAASAVTGAVDDAASALTGVAENVAGLAGDAAKTSLGWIKWALPLLLIGGLAWWMTNGQNPKETMGNADSAIENGANKTGDMTKAKAKAGTVAAGDASNAAENPVRGAGRAVSNFAKSSFATINDTGKAALDKTTFAANSAGGKMMEFIDGGFKGDGRVIFKYLTFTSGSDKIFGDSGVEVDNLAAILNAYPDVKINVAGHTDNTGNAEANKTLSENRAKSVKQRLMNAGISPSRVATQGFGAATPVASNDTKEGQAQNRRIEVTIAK